MTTEKNEVKTEDTPPTVQTGQPPEPVSPGPEEEPKFQRDPYVELEKDANGMWHWCLFSQNGRPMCMNILGFKRRNDAQKSFEATLEILRKRIKISAAIEA